MKKGIGILVTLIVEAGIVYVLAKILKWEFIDLTFLLAYALLSLQASLAAKVGSLVIVLDFKFKLKPVSKWRKKSLNYV
ncbi:hypothetical protein HFP67_30075 [Bacillus sp. CB102A.1]